jgi:hypothetical protein
MRHIESSVKISGGKPVEAAAVKYSLVQRLRNAFHVETVSEGVESFSVAATGKTTSYVFNLNVALKADAAGVRVIVDGGNEVSIATRIFYLLALMMVLGLTFCPVASDGEAGGSSMILEAMFFLVVGGFIIHDMNKKFDEPQVLLDRILKSVEVEFS